MQPLHPQVIQEQELGVDHVLNRNQGECHGVLLSREGVDRGGSNRTITPSNKIGADDKELVRVQCTARTDELFPPPTASVVLR